MERFLFRKQLQLLKCCSPVGIDSIRWRLFWFELVSGFFLLHLCRWRRRGLMTIFCVKLAVFSKPLPTFEELGNKSTKIQFWMNFHPIQLGWRNGYFGLTTTNQSIEQSKSLNGQSTSQTDGLYRVGPPWENSWVPPKYREYSQKYSWVFMSIFCCKRAIWLWALRWFRICKMMKSYIGSYIIF